jgi:hypothetical protein
MQPETCTLGKKYSGYVIARRIAKLVLNEEQVEELDNLFKSGELTLEQYIAMVIEYCEDEEIQKMLEDLAEKLNIVLKQRGCDYSEISGNPEEINKLQDKL